MVNIGESAGYFKNKNKIFKQKQKQTYQKKYDFFLEIGPSRVTAYVSGLYTGIKPKKIKAKKGPERLLIVADQPPLES